jgi:hypothetical protein
MLDLAEMRVQVYANEQTVKTREKSEQNIQVFRTANGVRV